MLAAIFKKPFNLSMEDYLLPKLDKKELLVKVEVCGLCGTDFHIFSGESYSKPPVIPGHEFVGIVSDKGSEVFNFEIGDRVAVDPNIYCGECKFCREGKINYCENLKALGVSINGGFAEYSIVSGSQAYLLPKDFSSNTAAFIEPLSCCIRGMDRASIKHGENLVILGGGTIGLLMVQLAKISGAGKIIVIEPIAEKREMAYQLGADYVLDSNSHELLARIKDLTTGGADVVIECVGQRAAADMAIKVARKGGRIILFGLAGKNDSINLNLHEFFLKELSVKSSLLNPFTFSRALNILVNKKVQVEKLNPVLKNLTCLETILSQPRDLSVIKYQITPN